LRWPVEPVLFLLYAYLDSMSTETATVSISALRVTHQVEAGADLSGCIGATTVTSWVACDARLHHGCGSREDRSKIKVSKQSR